MPIENLITLVAACLAFIASLIAAIVSLYNARFRRFTSERWWERKAEAYKNVVRSLVEMIESSEQWQKYEIEHRSGEDFVIGTSPDHVGIKEFQKARDQIRRFATEGDYILTIKATYALSELMNELDSELLYDDDPIDNRDILFDYLSDSIEAAMKCLKIVREQAKSDLKVR